jgi:hypothetical protein
MGLIVNIIHRKYYKAVTVFEGVDINNFICEFVSIGLMTADIRAEICSYVRTQKQFALPINMC